MGLQNLEKACNYMRAAMGVRECELEIIFDEN
jgi:hypothetical protein